MNSIAEGQDEILAIYKFRHRILSEQAENRNLENIDEKSVIIDPADDGAIHFIAKENNDLIAAVRSEYKSDKDDDLTRLGIHPGDQVKYRFCILRRFVADSRFFNSTKRISFIAYIFEKLLYTGVDYVLLEAEEDLIALYKSLGVKMLWTISGENENRRMLMFWFTKDLSHFQTIKSPFSNILLEYLNRPDQG